MPEQHVINLIFSFLPVGSETDRVYTGAAEAAGERDSARP